MNEPRPVVISMQLGFNLPGIISYPAGPESITGIWSPVHRWPDPMALAPKTHDTMLAPPSGQAFVVTEDKGGIRAGIVVP